LLQQGEGTSKTARRRRRRRAALKAAQRKKDKQTDPKLKVPENTFKIEDYGNKKMKIKKDDDIEVKVKQDLESDVKIKREPELFGADFSYGPWDRAGVKQQDIKAESHIKQERF